MACSGKLAAGFSVDDVKMQTGEGRSKGLMSLTRTGVQLEGDFPPPDLQSRLRAGAAFVLDRSFALFLGVAVGASIASAFLPAARRPAVPAPAAAPKVAEPVSAPAAPSPQDAAQPFTPGLLAKLAAGQPVTVGVFGDSFGDGLWTALYRRLPGTGNYRVRKFSEEATGFTRYGAKNLEDDARAKLAAEPVDIAVVDFGANDTQGLVDKGHGYALLGPRWRAAYGARVDGFVAALRQSGAMVYWVGLPKMRKPDYDGQIGALNAFYAERMAALGVPYLDVQALSADAGGGFSPYLPDADGSPRLMRAGDGIHMTVAGYERLAGPLIGRIDAYVARALVAAMLDRPPPPAPVPAPPAKVEEGAPCCSRP